MHPPKCTSCGSQSPQHAEMCLHTAGPTFPEEMGETQSEYSDSSCGESLSLPPLVREKEDPSAPWVLCSILLTLLSLIGAVLNCKPTGAPSQQPFIPRFAS